jgi:hypothetical protein
MDWQGLLHNRWVLIGAAGAALVGVVVLVTRKKSDTTTTPSVDTTGTDAAGWLSDYAKHIDDTLASMQPGPEAPAAAPIPTHDPRTREAPPTLPTPPVIVGATTGSDPSRSNGIPRPPVGAGA